MAQVGKDGGALLLPRGQRRLVRAMGIVDRSERRAQCRLNSDDRVRGGSQMRDTRGNVGRASLLCICMCLGARGGRVAPDARLVRDGAQVRRVGVEFNLCGGELGLERRALLVHGQQAPEADGSEERERERTVGANK